MLQQYLDLKKSYSDAILFFRLGDFYEMFFEDAITAAPILEVQLTSRDKRSENPIPMAGVPFHAANQYIKKLLTKGYKVALCEQLEDPSQAKGIVRRDVVRVVTPALVGEPELVSEDSTPRLISLQRVRPLIVEVCCFDLFAGKLRLGEVALSQLPEKLLHFSPKEILSHSELVESSEFQQALELLGRPIVTLRDGFYEGSRKKGGAHRALLKYLKETQKREDLDFGVPAPLFEERTMQLDSTTIRSLELLEGQMDPEGPNLFQTINQTVTPMGRRLLKEWIQAPSLDGQEIVDRQEGIAHFISDPSLAQRLRGLLSQIRDLERLTSKTLLGLSGPRDLVAIREILVKVPFLRTELQHACSPQLEKISLGLDPLEDLTQTLSDALEDDPPVLAREGGVLRETFHPEIAEYRKLSRDAKGTIAALEATERARTGIANLKIRYHKVFGYTIEVTRSQLNKVPNDYHRKQTISTGERFVTEGLKEFEEKVIQSEHRLVQLEEALFLEIRQKVAHQAAFLFRNASVLGTLDVLLGLSKVAYERAFCRPTIHSGWDLTLKDCRHPVIEALLAKGEFVPNDVHFDESSSRTLLVTGPNMAGKSTVMRQVAQCLVLSQIGSYVPASQASLPLVDAIFTRIGSADNLAAGHSTFMVEMTEVARILKSATPHSFILIDEVGRGTSTYDGLSLAWAILEYLHQEVGAKTFFATHFHEITSLEDTLAGLRNFNILVEKWEDRIVFLRKLVFGACSQSYGIEVAKLAHLPAKALSRAKGILSRLERQSGKGFYGRSAAMNEPVVQLGLFDAPE